MGLLPDTQNCGLRMRRECRERFPRHRLQWKPPVSDPGMHHGTCVTHVPWCMSGSPTHQPCPSPAFPAHAQPASLRIWQEVHCNCVRILIHHLSYIARRYTLLCGTAEQALWWVLNWHWTCIVLHDLPSHPQFIMQYSIVSYLVSSWWYSRVGSWRKILSEYCVNNWRVHTVVLLHPDL